MALVKRFLPPSGTTSLTTAGGRSYKVSTTVDIPVAELDGLHTGLGPSLGWYGATADRPVAQVGRTNWPILGMAMYDSTLAKEIFYVGSASTTGWTDINGSAV
jgi:hypothetical protein